jgi:DNA-binding response OmpR family regulator
MGSPSGLWYAQGMRAVEELYAYQNVVSRPRGIFPRILVTDDDPKVVRGLKVILEGFGYEVFCGYDGRMAIHLARREQPDLVIMGIGLTMVDGLKALEYLRLNPHTQSIPVILLIGCERKNEYSLLVNQPRLGFMKKPIDLNRFVAIVKQFLDMYPVAA